MSIEDKRKQLEDCLNERISKKYPLLEQLGVAEAWRENHDAQGRERGYSERRLLNNRTFLLGSKYPMYIDLQRSFDWSKTPEGWDYWESIWWELKKMEGK